MCGLVAGHPGMELVFAAASSRAGERLRLGGRELELVATGDAPLAQADLVFAALPHGASLEWVEAARGAGARVVDLSADLRPGGGARRELPRRTAQPASDGGGIVPYGLTELMRSRLAGASVVANPGCYPTAILIALAPLVIRGLVAPGATITVSAASGVTGAGFTPRPELMFAEVSGDFRAYAVGNAHRHLDEMRSVLHELGGDADILFTPHLLPVPRGILATMTVPVTAIPDDPLSVWREAYAGEPFVEVSEAMPALRDVLHRNVVRVSAARAENLRQPTLVVVAAIDNLVKGAAGQAVQNANVLLGLAETMGLPA